MRRALYSVPVLICLAGLAHAEEPRDDAEMVVAYKKGEPIAVSEILKVWARHFGALPLPHPNLQGVKITFHEHTDRPLKWKTIKAVLKFHDVQVTESQAGPGGHWLITARLLRDTRVDDSDTFVKAEDLPATEQVVTAVFNIEHGAAASIYATLRGLQARNPRPGNTLYVTGPEIIIMVDLTSRIRYYASVIKALDAPGPRKRLEVYQVLHAKAPELADVVLRVVGGLEGPGRSQPGRPQVVGPSQGRAQGDGLQVIADARTNRLAIAAYPLDFALVERVIAEFDVPIPRASSRTKVYRCKNAKAEDMEARLRQLFPGQPGATGTGAPPVPGRGPRPLGPPSAETPTLFVADPESNSLLIQADPEVYREALVVLAELDRRPLRANVEIMVYEVSTPTDQLSVAFEIAGLTQAHDGSVRPAGGTSFGLTDIAPKLDESGNITSLSRTPNVGAGLTALLTKDTFDRLPIIMTAVHNFEQTRIIDRSFTMTNDNKKSTFSITTTAPYVKSDVTDGIAVQSVENAEAKTEIEITPRINSDESVTLELNLTFSVFSGSGTATLPPGTNTRRYSGEALTVPNGAYAVFGGLESETERKVEVKVPLLGDIPILGHLFKSQTHTRTKSRLYIFVRPTILQDEEFDGTKQIAQHLLNTVALESGHEPWLPLVQRRMLEGPDYTLIEECLDTFGTGSANPFN